MAQKHDSPATDPSTEPKKRRRVGFSPTDTGVEANDCFKVYLVSSKEEVGAPDGLEIDPVDLNHFFEEDGKIYGYTGLKIIVWISSISFHSYVDITYQNSSDGGKGITDLKSALENIFGNTLVENKDAFLQTFSTESQFIRSLVSNGEILQQKSSSSSCNTKSHSPSDEASSNVEVVRLIVGKSDAGLLYSRLIPLVFLLVDGSSPIDVTDPSWELYVTVERTKDQHGDVQRRLLGFAAVYRFFHYPDSVRLRLSQLLVFPPYQHKGYGRNILEVLNSIAISEDVHDFTIEEPVDYLQHLRTCIDILRLLDFDPIKDVIDSAVSRLRQGKLSKKTDIWRLLPPASAAENVRRCLKINKKQFIQCWEVLVYLGLDAADKCMEDFITLVSKRVKDDIIGKDSGNCRKQVVDVASEYDPDMSFVMFRSKAGDSSSVQVDENQEEQLQKLADERMQEIKLVAKRVSLNHARN